MLLNRFVSIPILFPLYNKSLGKARALCDLFKCSTVKHSHVAITACYATRWSIQGQQPEMRLLNMYQACLEVDPRVRTSLLIRVSIRKTLKARCNKSRMQNFSEFPPLGTITRKPCFYHVCFLIFRTEAFYFPYIWPVSLYHSLFTPPMTFLPQPHDERLRSKIDLCAKLF